MTNRLTGVTQLFALAALLPHLGMMPTGGTQTCGYTLI